MKKTVDAVPLQVVNHRSSTMEYREINSNHGCICRNRCQLVSWKTVYNTIQRIYGRCGLFMQLGEENGKGKKERAKGW